MNNDGISIQTMVLFSIFCRNPIRVMNGDKHKLLWKINRFVKYDDMKYTTHIFEFVSEYGKLEILKSPELKKFISKKNKLQKKYFKLKNKNG